MPLYQPEYRLKIVKEKVRSGEWRADLTAQNGAWDDFRWDVEDMAKVLLKLNDKDHSLNRQHHHFYKTEPFKQKPHILLDFYKAINIKDGEDVYIHLYIRQEDGKLIINSFHQLDL